MSCVRVIQLQKVGDEYKPVTDADAIAFDAFKATVGLSKTARLERRHVKHLNTSASLFGFHFSIVKASRRTS